MQFKGTLSKMLTEYQNPVRYYLELEEDAVSVNQLINKTIEINLLGYECRNCNLNKPIKSSGYCNSCFFIVPQTQESVFRPEKSKAHLGVEDRDLAWEKSFQLQPHIVYLANTSGLKVGVTRFSQQNTRWMDQGASQAIVLAKTENRYEAGLIEVALSTQLADKTNYRKMLTSVPLQIDMMKEREKYSKFIPEDLAVYSSQENRVWQIEYPVISYPSKITSLKIKEGIPIKKELVGIKGQYLLFDDNTVLNIRSHEGYKISLDI